MSQVQLTQSGSTGNQSVALFTMHKAASTYVGNVLTEVLASNGYATEDIASEAFAKGVDETSYIGASLNRLNRPWTFFGPFRTESVPPVVPIKTVRPVVHIRDPRDCIVSLYYSLAFSHVEPGPGAVRDQFLKDREQFRLMGVDEFCHEALRRGYDALGIMRRAAEARDDCIISRYEEMVSNFQPWIREIISSLKLSPNHELLSSLQNESFEVQEDMYRHKRQVTPGDFKRKLKLETQRMLTNAFESELRYFGYSLITN